MPSKEQCPEIRAEIRKFCSKYRDEYWRKLDKENKYPEQFVLELTEAGWLAALIPEQYGGSGLSMKEASVILEEINRSGGNSADRKSTRLNSSHIQKSRMPSSA